MSGFADTLDRASEAARPGASNGRKRLRRLVLINDACKARGGATGLVLLSIRLLRAQGIPVTLITGDDGGAPELAELGVETVALGGSHIAKGNAASAFVNGLYNRSARRLIADWIAANDAPGTVYHVHGWSKILSPSIFPALAPVADRMILHAHDFFLSCPNGAFQDYRRDETCHRVPLSASCLGTNCDKRSYGQKVWRSVRSGIVGMLHDSRFADVPILLIHDRMKDFFVRAGLGADRFRVLRNPVDPFTTKRIEAERNAVFYFIGRIEREKGVLDAVAAAARAGVTIRLIGDGPERADVERDFPQVQIDGWSSREAIGERIADARALVMPSRYPEPFGLVAVEASRSGLPVILSRKSFLAEEFGAQGLGFGCDTADVSAFAAQLRALADMPADGVRAISERAFGAGVAIATTPFEWCDRLIDIYEEKCIA